MKSSTCADMITTSPLPVPAKPFGAASIALTPTTSHFALKPSPRSQLCYTGSTSTPTFVDELSFHDDDDFFLLSPDELSASDALTYSSSSPKRRLLPRPHSITWNREARSGEVASFMVIDDMPKLSFKRPREGAFVLSKRTRNLDSSFFGETTGADYVPEAITRADSRTELRFDTRSRIPLTPKSQHDCNNDSVNSPPQLINHDSSEEIQFCGGGSSDLFLPILS